MNRILRLVALAAVIPLLAGCTSLFPAADTSTPVKEDVASDLQPFYQQTLKWRSCETGMQCATATAPLDWSKPDGDTIKLALIRKQASGTSLGSLFVNPGGPGASGYDMLATGTSGAVDATLAKNYDIVSWDPRGVGRSTPVDCGGASVLDSYIYDIADGTIGSDEWFDSTEAGSAAFAKACADGTGDLLGHVDTASTARDLDMLRSAVGDDKLNYLGYSYGTFIGATYANLFPTKTGHLVLDGAVDPEETIVDVNNTQAKGFESALRAYLTSCVGTADCPFSGTVDEAVTTIGQLLDSLDASPIRNSDGRELGSGTMGTAIVLPLYSKDNWPYLSQLFQSVMAGDASVAFALADSYNDRSDTGTYSSNLMEAFNATTCLDYPATETRDEARADAAALSVSAPLFGSRWGYGGSSCSQWPYAATRTPGPMTASGSAQILVLGTTNDPATPYANAQALASELENGHLVSYTGEGHTAYNGDSTCINDVVDAYFVDGTVPATDPKC